MRRIKSMNYIFLHDIMFLRSCALQKSYWLQQGNRMQQNQQNIALSGAGNLNQYPSFTMNEQNISTKAIFMRNIQGVPNYLIRSKNNEKWMRCNWGKILFASCFKMSKVLHVTLCSQLMLPSKGAFIFFFSSYIMKHICGYILRFWSNSLLQLSESSAWSPENVFIDKNQWKKSRKGRSGEQAGHFTGPRRPFHKSGISSSNNSCTARL